MALRSILILIAAALLIRLLFRQRGRGWALLAASALAVYWMQPALPVRYLDYWLPTLTLALAALCWLLTTPPEARSGRDNRIAAGVLAAVALGVALTRSFGLEGILTPSRPPQLGQVLLFLSFLVLLGWGLSRLKQPSSRWLTTAIVILLALLVVLKTPALATAASGLLRTAAGQSTGRAAAFDVRWLGFSYIAFRLIHTLRDRQNGRLPAVSLQEYLVYALFFPAFTAGPIDRLERFLQDLRRPLEPAADDFVQGGQRLAVGLFKKFALADSLALIALNGSNTLQTGSTGWMWVLLYAYSFQIYFDFSGYTDIAIGLGRLLGVKLPENFNHPYLKPNLTQFWNNWHMTLTQWFRAYYFNPLTRGLRRSGKNLPPWAVILITQVSTMLLIGLWHGVTWNFVLWGLWHGLGQFAQNRWSEAVRARAAALQAQPLWGTVMPAANVLLTFHYVALGWVWFALPAPHISLLVLQRLFGL
jgi:D-alanyl-lipoteichoic acid acyltransferase DltB (MBOAT superfamily)